MYNGTTGMTELVHTSHVRVHYDETDAHDFKEIANEFVAHKFSWQNIIENFTYTCMYFVPHFFAEY